MSCREAILRVLNIQIFLLQAKRVCFTCTIYCMNQNWTAVEQVATN